MIGYLDSIASKVTFGVQHSLDLEFFKEFTVAVEFFFVISTAPPATNGANTDATGIRQYEIDETNNAMITPPNKGRLPKNAFPASIDLHTIF